MLWDPSVLGPAQHPGTCPGREGQPGEKPPTLGTTAGWSCQQPIAAGVKPFTPPAFPREGGKNQVEAETFFFFPPTGAMFPWHPVGSCLSTDLMLRGVQECGKGRPGCPSIMGTPTWGSHCEREPGQRMLPRCHPNVPKMVTQALPRHHGRRWHRAA